MAIITGDEVKPLLSDRRGVVVDGHVLKSGPNKGKIEVMWIGGRYTTAERPEELELVIENESDQEVVEWARKYHDPNFKL